jgi:hypothetical protein
MPAASACPAKAHRRQPYFMHFAGAKTAILAAALRFEVVEDDAPLPPAPLLT